MPASRRRGCLIAAPRVTSAQGIDLPESLKATGKMEELIEHTEIFLMVVPTPFVAATIAGIKDKLKPNQVCYLFLELARLTDPRHA